MSIEIFQMERMQSTWENVVDYDMSESGVRPLTLRELTAMGFDLDAFLDQPLGYSQSNGTIELRERIAALYPDATIDHVEVTNGTSEANYIVALSRIEPGDVVAMQVPNYMQMWGVARSLGAEVRTFRLRTESSWEPDWDEFDAAVTPKTRLLYLSNPNNPTGSVLSSASMRRIADRCQQTGTWLLSDEVYLGAEVSGPRTTSFWGMSDRVIVTSGLSKAYGLPGLRIGWIAGPPGVVDELWGVHDYTTIAPGALSDLLARIALSPEGRARLLARTRGIIRANYPVVASWIAKHRGLSHAAPEAGAIVYVKYDHPINSTQLVERLRVEQSVLVVPGDHFAMDGYLRIGFGSDPDHLRGSLQRIGEFMDALR